MILIINLIYFILLNYSAATPIVSHYPYRVKNMNKAITPQIDEQLFYNKMEKLGAAPHIALSDSKGHIRLAHSEFSPFEGVFNPEPFLTINMATKYIGRIKRVSDKHHLEGILRPGTVGIALPNSGARGYWTKTQILAIAIDLEALANENPAFSITADALSDSAATLHNDALLSSVITAIWRDAEIHGLTSAFFEHGLLVILNRLSELKPHYPSKKHGRALTGYRLNTVLDLIEERLSSNLTLTELAESVDQDKSSFSRAFREAVGYAPYEYFTIRRMERAKQLLCMHLPVTEVALQLGYSNPSKFSAAFRKINGFTPSEWKRSQALLN